MGDRGDTSLPVQTPEIQKWRNLKGVSQESEKGSVNIYGQTSRFVFQMPASPESDILRASGEVDVMNC